MKLKSLLLSSFAFVGLLSAHAQTPAGDAYYVDYDLFQTDNVVHWINAGNDASLMPATALTIEAWVQVRSPAWNQKIVGKLNNSFNSGYMMGIDQGKVYPEIWTPSQSQLLDGFVPPTPEPYYWIHLAITWAKGGMFTAYINGEQVGQTAASNNDISSNSDDLIIGIAPWDLSNFQTFGKLDEIRVWDVERSASEITGNMFNNLSGSETGLVLYYDFDGATGTTVTDMSTAGNDGTVMNPTGNDFAPSEAVLGNADAQAMTDLNGLWNALAFNDPRFVTTTNGLSVLASNIPDVDYLVFGHDAGSGTSTSDIPASAATNFERSTRIWYLDQVGTFDTDLIFDLPDVSAGGSQLTDIHPANYYTLLYRATNSGPFTALAAASGNNAGSITFSGIAINDGYYAIGVGEGISVGMDELSALENSLNIYPNPSNGLVQVNFTPTSNQFGFEILDVTGKTIAEFNNANGFNGSTQLDLSNQASGFYFIRAFDGDVQTTQKLSLQK